MLRAKINLAMFPHVLMTKKGKEGNQIEGIFIPIEKAKLFKSEKGNVYLDVVGFNFNDKNGDNTHILKQNLSKDERDKMSDEDLKAMPILGNAKVDNGFGELAPNNPMPNNAPIDADDDLPF